MRLWTSEVATSHHLTLPCLLPQFFVVGHDCGHRSFSSNKLLEDIVGTLMFMPLIYPFEPWRIKHNQHHAFTNKLVDDTAWHPVMESEIEKWSPMQKNLYQVSCWAAPEWCCQLC